MNDRRAARGSDEVLRGAGRVIARRGADATRFADVAAETGSAISTLQYRFGSREDLILAALRHANTADVARVQAALEGIDDPVEQLRVYTQESMRAHADAEEAQAAWLIWVEYWRAAVRDEELAREWHAVYTQWSDLLRPILSGGVRAGVFHMRDVDATAAQVLALVDGLYVPMVLGDTWTPPPPVALNLALSGVAALVGCPELDP